MSASGIPASKLYLLHELAHVKQGTKVRIAGCIISLHPSPRAPETLTLASSYPSTTTSSTCTPAAGAGNSKEEEEEEEEEDEEEVSTFTASSRISVDIAHVRDGQQDSKDWDVGSWVNIIGYVSTDAAPRQSAGVQPKVCVQAILMWPARGSMTGVREQYEDAVRARRAGMAALEAAREVHETISLRRMPTPVPAPMPSTKQKTPG